MSAGSSDGAALAARSGRAPGANITGLVRTGGTQRLAGMRVVRRTLPVGGRPACSVRAVRRCLDRRNLI